MMAFSPRTETATTARRNDPTSSKITKHTRTANVVWLTLCGCIPLMSVTVSSFWLPSTIRDTRFTSTVSKIKTNRLLPLDAPATATTTTTALNAKRRQMKQRVDKSRPKQFFDAIDDANDRKKKEEANSASSRIVSGTSDGTIDDNLAEQGSDVDPRVDVERTARLQEARMRMEKRPEVSTMIVDNETGIEIIAQGKRVMDVVTRQAVQLSLLGPEYRLAQQFPGVPPDIRQKYRFDWKTITADQMVEQLRGVCSVKREDNTRAIPSHPSIANMAIDFVVANRDYLGSRMKRLLGRLYMRSLSQGNKQEGMANLHLWKNYMTLENHISAPFRQMIMDSEARVGPNFGNLDVKSYCGKDLYERCADYLVLKGMVAHWEKKVVDADYVEKTPITKDNYITVISKGDPRRYLPDPPILFTLKECTQVCYMAQQMTKAFVETAELFNDLPPELRFVEEALSVRGGTPLRKFVVEQFCPAEGINPEGLREGLRRLIAQLGNMQIDPYGDLTNILERLSFAMAVGTDDARNPYSVYIANPDRNGPGAFQTYTFNHEKLSLVRFLDSQYERQDLPNDSQPFNMDINIDNLFGRAGVAAPASKPSTSSYGTKSMDPDFYVVPKARAAGRPHELGWLHLLDDEIRDEKVRFGKVPRGRIIPDETVDE